RRYKRIDVLSKVEQSREDQQDGNHAAQQARAQLSQVRDKRHFLVFGGADAHGCCGLSWWLGEAGGSLAGATVDVGAASGAMLGDAVGAGVGLAVASVFGARPRLCFISRSRSRICSLCSWRRISSA